MIQGPAQAVGLDCEPDLVDTLVKDALGQSGGLALLGAVLQDLYQVGAQAGTLTLAQYQDQLGGWRAS